MKQIEVGGTELLRMTDASKTQLNYWIRSGGVVPEINTYGSGNRRTYNSRNIAEVGICKELNKFGLSPVVMKVALDVLRGNCVWMEDGEPIGFGDFRGSGGTSFVGGEMLSYWDFIREFPKKKLVLFINVDAGRFTVGLEDAECFKLPLPLPGLSMVVVDLAGIESKLGLR